MTSPSTPPRRSRSALAQRSSMVPGRPTCSSRGLPERERWTIYELAKAGRRAMEDRGLQMAESYDAFVRRVKEELEL